MIADRWNGIETPDDQARLDELADREIERYERAGDEYMDGDRESTRYDALPPMRLTVRQAS